MGNQRDDKQKQAIAENLRNIIFLESSKPYKDIDSDLIKECVDFLMEIEGNEKLSQEQIEKARERFLDSAKSNGVSINKPTKKLKFKALLAAACIVIVLVIASFTAMAFGVDTVAILKEFGDSIVEMFAGEKEEYKGVTIIKNGDTVKYDSIDSFIENESIDVLYPTILPSGEKISCIQIFDEEGMDEPDKVYRNINFVVLSSDIAISISEDPAVSKRIIENKNYNVKTINGFTCYIDNSADAISIQYNIIYNSKTLTINTTTEEDALLIINNLKESN